MGMHYLEFCTATLNLFCVWLILHIHYFILLFYGEIVSKIFRQCSLKTILEKERNSDKNGQEISMGKGCYGGQNGRLLAGDRTDWLLFCKYVKLF